MFIIRGLKIFFLDTVWAILYFPLWWYTGGLKLVLAGIGREIKEFAWNLNLNILFRYLFQPMYGLRDFWSRVISFLVRIVYFFLIFIIFIIWCLVLFLLLLCWLILPIFIVYNIFWQLNLLEINIYEILYLPAL